MAFLPWAGESGRLGEAAGVAEDVAARLGAVTAQMIADRYDIAGIPEPIGDEAIIRLVSHLSGIERIAESDSGLGDMTVRHRRADGDPFDRTGVTVLLRPYRRQIGAWLCE